jgi:uncharacterized protein (DUF427 family)
MPSDVRMNSIARPYPIGPGQESVWDYPRPPRLERVARRLRVVLGGETIADTSSGLRVLETSHPPVYYFPPPDIRPGTLAAVPGRSVCEWKAPAAYFDVISGTTRVQAGAWGYPKATEAFRPIRDYVAFYPKAMEACFVDHEQARPKPGGFYGGWITSEIVGPFKGEPGTQGW